jgi:hypothetical protein
VDSGWAAHAQRRAQNRMNVGASHLFCVGDRLRGIQAGCTRSAVNVEIASYIFLRWRADCVIFRLGCTRAPQTA